MHRSRRSNLVFVRQECTFCDPWFSRLLAKSSFRTSKYLLKPAALPWLPAVDVFCLICLLFHEACFYTNVLGLLSGRMPSFSVSNDLIAMLLCSLPDARRPRSTAAERGWPVPVLSGWQTRRRRSPMTCSRRPRVPKMHSRRP
jgi:hypothetical protein